MVPKVLEYHEINFSADSVAHNRSLKLFDELVKRLMAGWNLLSLCKVAASQITGDGYQASNEHSLGFGMAENRDGVEVEIRWMGRGDYVFKTVTSNPEYIAVEGRGELLVFPDRAHVCTG